MSKDSPTIVLLRRDLRLYDNPAFYHACQSGPIILLYVFDDTDNYQTSENLAFNFLGGASKWWLHKSLLSFNKSVTSLGGQLLIRRGSPETEIHQVATQTGAVNIIWNRRYEPNDIIKDKALKTVLKSYGYQVSSYCANLLSEPWLTFNKQKLPYKVFSAYWRHCLANIVVPSPFPIPSSIEFHRLNNPILQTICQLIT